MSLFLMAVGAIVWQTAFTTTVAPEPPSLTVNAFRTIGDDPSNGAFGDGLTEDLITALSSNPNIRVIAGHAAEGGGRTPSSRGGRYVLEGTVRGGVTVRITAQLVDAETGVHMWGGRYDRLLVDPLKQQSEVSTKIVATVTEKFAQIEREQAQSRQTIGGMAVAALEMLGRMAESAVALPGNVIARLFRDEQQGMRQPMGQSPTSGIATEM